MKISSFAKFYFVHGLVNLKLHFYLHKAFTALNKPSKLNYRIFYLIQDTKKLLHDLRAENVELSEC